jgi:hypothetical protein
MNTTTATDHDDDLDFLDTGPMTLKDWQEVISDDLDQAVDDLNENEIEELCRCSRRKIDDIDLPF